MRMSRWFLLFAVTLSRCAGGHQFAFGQVPTMPSTFTVAPVNAQTTGAPPFQSQIFLLNPSILVLSASITVAQSTGLPSGADSIQFVIDIESMAVQSNFSQGANVRRGANGTRSFAHGALARVWVAPARYFWPRNPFGVCQPAVQLVTPAIAVPSGQAFVCTGDGTWGGAAFSWNQAQFSWSNATNDGVWEQVQQEQGDWAVAGLPWQSATWKWIDTAGAEPQIWNTLP